MIELNLIHQKIELKTEIENRNCRNGIGRGIWILFLNGILYIGRWNGKHWKMELET